MAVGLSPGSAADRQLGLRARRDLQFRPQTHGGQRYWVVKDPVALKYFHLTDEEYAVLRMLDGRASLEGVRRRFEAQFAPRRLMPEQIHGYLATLHRYGLVLADAPGQGQQRLERRRVKRRRRGVEFLLGALAIRFPGINPARFLDWLYPKTAWIFSPACVAASVLLGCVAIALIAVQFDMFLARLPDVQAIVSASNLPWLLLAMVVIKILHELGHALACRYFGSDCHEIGVMLLVFMPCLYCNVSDSWMLPSKWRRIAVAAAGMYVELILASICTLVWWFSQPGLLNAMCLNTMLICSVGTLVINGNPLLRYDGYYILSDWLEIPNLRSESTAAARRLFARWFLGVDLGEPGRTTSKRRALLVAYAVASTVYRWIVVITILWALNLVARPYHLEPLVALLAVVTVVGMFVPVASGALRWARDPSHRRRTAPTRVVLSGLLLLGIVLVVVLAPLPMRVSAPLVLRYHDAQRVYVTVPGQLVASVGEGETVAKGDVLAELASPSVKRELATLRSDRDRQRLFLENLEARRLQGVDDGARIPAAKASLADIDERLAQLERDASALTIVAPRDGTVLPPPSVSPEAHADRLHNWSGTPLQPRNLGCFLDTGTLLCLVGDRDRFEAVLHVPQTDVELVAPGQSVRIVLDHLPGQVFRGTVTEVAKLDLEVMPRELAVAGDVPSRSDQSGVRRPLDTWYQARVVFDDHPPHFVARVHGSAKIRVAPRSLGAQLARYLWQTFAR